MKSEPKLGVEEIKRVNGLLKPEKWTPGERDAFWMGYKLHREKAKEIVVKSRNEWRLVNGEDTVDAAHQGIWNELDK